MILKNSDLKKLKKVFVILYFGLFYRKQKTETNSKYTLPKFMIFKDVL